jgi:signal transduction histidine kinase
VAHRRQPGDRRPDGSTVPVEVATHSLPSSGGPLLAGVVTDLSEKRRLEQQLIQSGKLAAIGELAAGVAHEINNPLLAILGLTEFLLLDSPEGTKERERLDLIQQTGLEIKEIVRALLDFARANPNESRVVDLEFVVRRTIDFVRRTNANKGIELVEHYGADGACVTAYGDQLEQVVLNLLANARQSMPNGGVITIDVRRDGDHVLVVISDEGPGVPSDLEDRIFDPFFTTRRSTGGTGLGLSVSLGIASAHGGTLTLASEPGRGAAFTLRLPLQPEPAS